MSHAERSFRPQAGSLKPSCSKVLVSKSPWLVYTFQDLRLEGSECQRMTSRGVLYTKCEFIEDFADEVYPDMYFVCVCVLLCMVSSLHS